MGNSLVLFHPGISGVKWATTYNLDLLKVVAKNAKYSPNGGLIVIYHGRKFKKNIFNKSKIIYYI